MIKVIKRRDEPIEKTLRRFKKRCEKEGLVKDIKKNEYFESRKVRERRTYRKMIKRIEKETAEENNKHKR